MSNPERQTTSVDLNAPVIARHSLLIAAPAERIWQIHVAVSRWPEWQTDILSAELRGAFEVGGSFTWKTQGIDEPITSDIYIVEPGLRTLWGGTAQGITGIHEWRFSPTANGVLVSTVESWAGAAVEKSIEPLQAALDASLERWLGFLARRGAAG